MVRSIKKLLKTLGFGNYSKFLESAMTHSNLRAISLICVLSVFSSILFLHLSYTDAGYDLDFYRLINRVNVVISVIAFLIVLLFRKKLAKSFHRFHALMFAFIFWLTLCSFGVAAGDCMNHGGFIFFLTAQVWIYDVIMIPPFVSIVLSGISFFSFLCFISHISWFPSAKYMEAIIFYITIIAINYFHYENAVHRINIQEEVLHDNDRLNHLSITDGLTAVKNRTGLRLDFSHLYSDHLYVMMCDIDNFKKYNDVYGHATGDVVLSSFAFSLGEAFGKENVYRYGGDEFLVIYSSASEGEFKKCLNLTTWYCNKMKFEGMDRPSCSIGYVYGDCHSDEELRAMIQEADEQLYQAKKNGKGQIASREFVPEKWEQKS